MKTLIITLLFFAFYNATLSQDIVFKGVLYEHNSKTKTGKIKPIQNAQVLIQFSTPSITDNNGKFKTQSSSYKLGESTKVVVKKSGYEVVNIKDLENVIAGSIEDVKIFMAPQNQLYESQLNYYNLAKKSINYNFELRFKKLEEERKLKEIKLKNNREEFEKFLIKYSEKSLNLENEKSVAINNAQDLSKKIAEINLDFADDLLRKSIGYFSIGNIDSCLILLNSSQFKYYEKKALQNIKLLTESINNEAKIIQSIIDKDFFRAQIYQTKLQNDSVNEICEKISNLSFKNHQSIGLESVIKNIKNILKLDPNYTFSWIKSDYYEDLLSVIRLTPKGRGSIYEADVLRLFGQFKMNVLADKESLIIYNKARLIYKNNLKPDTFLIDLDILKGFVLFNLDGLEVKNITEPLISFQNNPFYFDKNFPDPESFEYIIKSFCNILSENSSTMDDIIDNTLIYITHSSNQRKFDPQFFDLIHFIRIKTYYDKNKVIDSTKIIELIKLGKEININSLEFLVYSSKVSEIYFDNLSNILNSNDKYINLIKDHTIKLYKDINRSNLSENITIENKIKYELTAITFEHILYSFGVETNDYVNQLQKLFNFWFYSAAKKPGASQGNAYWIYKLIAKTNTKCDPEFENIFMKISNMLLKNNVYNGINFYKKFLIDYIECNKEKSDTSGNKINFSPLVDNLYSICKSNFESQLDTNYLYSGFEFNRPDNSKSVTNNIIESFYFGNDYALKCGKTGVVTEINNEIIKANEKIDYDSLWSIIKNFEVENINSDSSVIDKVYNQIYEGSIKGMFDKNDTIRHIKFEDGTEFIGELELIKSSLAFRIYDLYGNSALFDFDYFTRILMLENDEKSNYIKNIHDFNRFIEFGLNDFFIGYSHQQINSLGNLCIIYLYAYKANLALNNEINLNKFHDFFNLSLSKLSDINKIFLLNDFLFLSDNTDYTIDKANLKKIDYDTKFVNSLYDIFKNLIVGFEFQKLNYMNEREIEIFKLELYLTLTSLSHIDNFDSSFFEELKTKYPNEARIYRNEALFYFRKNDSKKAINSLQKAIELKYDDIIFFTNKIELKKYHTKIIKCFK